MAHKCNLPRSKLLQIVPEELCLFDLGQFFTEAQLRIEYRHRRVCRDVTDSRVLQVIEEVVVRCLCLESILLYAVCEKQQGYDHPDRCHNLRHRSPFFEIQFCQFLTSIFWLNPNLSFLRRNISGIDALAEDFISRV